MEQRDNQAGSSYYVVKRSDELCIVYGFDTTSRAFWAIDQAACVFVLGHKVQGGEAIWFSPRVFVPNVSIMQCARDIALGYLLQRIEEEQHAEHYSLDSSQCRSGKEVAKLHAAINKQREGEKEWLTKFIRAEEMLYV